MANKLLMDPEFIKIMSIHRNFGLTVWIAIQDIVATGCRLRALCDHMIIWHPNKSDLIPIFNQLKREKDIDKEAIKQIFQHPHIYTNRHDFVTFNLMRPEYTRNLQEKINIMK